MEVITGTEMMTKLAAGVALPSDSDRNGSLVAPIGTAATSVSMVAEISVATTPLNPDSRCAPRISPRMVTVVGA